MRSLREMRYSRVSAIVDSKELRRKASNDFERYIFLTFARDHRIISHFLCENFSDDEEKSYWDKIARDRKEKLSAKQRVKQRGRDKLLKRAEKKLGKCIKFDQD